MRIVTFRSTTFRLDKKKHLSRQFYVHFVSTSQLDKPSSIPADNDHYPGHLNKFSHTLGQNSYIYYSQFTQKYYAMNTFDKILNRLSRFNSDIDVSNRSTGTKLILVIGMALVMALFVMATVHLVTANK